MTYLRFGIRDLLWAMMVGVVASGMGIGWWVDRTHLCQDAVSANVRASAAFTKARRFELAYLEATGRSIQAEGAGQP
jgi:hypothetical protein